jgi:hypothetical protein
MKNRGFFLLFLAMASNANTVSAQTPAVEVEVYDYTNLNAAVLRQFVATTQEILATSGVSLEVDVCARGGEPCERHAGSSRLIAISLVADAPKGQKKVRWDTLGQSITSHEGGTYATVFLKRVEAIASEENIPLNVVLAYVAAHEMGHLLLGSPMHSKGGLMKADWGSDDYLAMAQNRFHFSPEQTRELTSRYGNSDQVHGDAGTAVATQP